MRAESFEFLKSLIEVPSPSGFEQPAQELIRNYMGRYAEEVRTDVHGNVIAALNPGAPLRIMLAGHCDEIGFMVTHVDDKGFIYFGAIGGVDQSLVPAQRVRIHTKRGAVLGVVGKKAIHLLEPEERQKIVPLKKLWIDIGARSKREATRLVEPGDPITFAVGLERLQKNAVAGRGFDDKIGSFVVAETVRLLTDAKLKVAVYAVSTVQEELGLRGARTSAFSIDPHAGIAVDVGFATDYPTSEKSTEGDVTLGKGPILNKGANINRVLGDMLVKAARKRKIPYQMTGAPLATGSDANAIQITRAGVAAALVSVPNRYMHTPAEIVSLDDAENASKLLAGALEDMPSKVDFTP